MLLQRLCAFVNAVQTAPKMIVLRPSYKRHGTTSGSSLKEQRGCPRKAPREDVNAENRDQRRRFGL